MPVSPGTSAALRSAATAAKRDARLALVQEIRDVRPGDAELARSQRSVTRGLRLLQARAGLALHVGGHAGNLRDAIGDVVAARDPLLPLGVVIALHPALDRDQHADISSRPTFMARA